MKRPVTNSLILLLIAGYFICSSADLFAHWGMTRSQEAAFVVLLVAATLWISEAIPLFVTSFVIVAMSLTWLRGVFVEDGIDIKNAAFLSPFFSDIILLFLGGFVLSSGLHRFQIDEQLARWVIRKTGSSPGRLLAGIIVITACNSMILSNTATAAMMLTLCLPILRQMPPGHSFRKALILAVPFSANIGGMGTPIGTPPNAIAMQYLVREGHPIGFVTWIIMAIPVVILLLLAMWILLRFMYRGADGEVRITENDVIIVKQHDWQRTVVILTSLVTVVGWLTSNWHPLTTGTVALLPVIVFFGLRILDNKDFRNLSWDVLFVMGGGLCLGVIIASSGLDVWMVKLIPVEGLGMVAFVVIFAACACLMSTLMSNTATANLMMPIVLGLGVLDASLVLIGVAFACSAAMALPVSTPPNAIAFSSGEITVRDMLRTGLIISIVGLILICTLGQWWWGLVESWSGA